MISSKPQFDGLKRTSPKSDKIEVVKVLILAIVSFGCGFGLVIFFLGPSKSSSQAGTPEIQSPVASASALDPAQGKQEGAGGYAPVGSPGYSPTPSVGGAPGAVGGAATPDQEQAMADEATAPPEVPPGRTPENVALDGSAFYLKCWDDSGTEIAGTSCDQLTVLEKRFSTRLYVVDKCKKEHAGEKAEGKLSLGMEVNFAEKSLSFWNGASSTLENANPLTRCLREELKGLPTHSVEHKYQKYRLFFTVLFGKLKAKAATTSAEAEKSKPSLKVAKGAMLNVVKDKVRVRRTPVDGEIIGKISSGNQVKLLKRKGEWCNILTPNNNEGWMICEALSK